MSRNLYKNPFIRRNGTIFEWISMSNGFAWISVLVFLIALYVVMGESVSGTSAIENAWIERAPIPVAMLVEGTATLSGWIYSFGLDSKDNSITFAYNPSTNVWIKKASMPTSSVYFGIAVYQSKIYIMGGAKFSNNQIENVDYDLNQVFDPATNNWSTKEPMPIKATAINANVVNNKIYVVSGYSLNGALLNFTQIYDPEANNWAIAKSSIPTPVAYYASGVINDKIYVAGGASSTSDSTNQLQIYDTQTDEWTIGAPLPTAVSQAVGTATLGIYAPPRLYVVGGRSVNSYFLKNNQIYDPQTNNWSAGKQFPNNPAGITQQGLTVTNFNDTLYFVGGTTQLLSGYYESTEQYIPENYNGTIPSPQVGVPPTANPFPTTTVAVFLIAVTVVVVCAYLVFYFTHLKRSNLRHK